MSVDDISVLAYTLSFTWVGQSASELWHILQLIINSIHIFG